METPGDLPLELPLTSASGLMFAIRMRLMERHGPRLRGEWPFLVAGLYGALRADGVDKETAMRDAIEELDRAVRR